MSAIIDIMEIAERLRTEHGLPDCAAELERIATSFVDAVIFELSDRERKIADLRDALAKERRKRPASQPHWLPLTEIGSITEVG